MKKILLILFVLSMILLLLGCNTQPSSAQVVATTLPVYEFTSRICQGTDIRVERLITEDVSCLHDYTLKVSQMRLIENAEIVVVNGAGLEDFLDDALNKSCSIVDASQGITLLCAETETEHNGHDHGHGHHHEYDPHIWLSIKNAQIMSENILQSLITAYPQYETSFRENYSILKADFETLSAYAQEQLSNLPHRKLVTFHDGFSYMAVSFGLDIIHSVEEESGSETSAETLISIIELVQNNGISAIFTEMNGSSSAASIIASETGASTYALDMGLSQQGYFEAMYYNIDTLKEALQ